MKIIMTIIVTMMATTLAMQASTTLVKKEFTVAQIATDTAAESEASVKQALKEIQEDKNQTKEGGKKEKEKQ